MFYLQKIVEAYKHGTLSSQSSSWLRRNLAYAGCLRYFLFNPVKSEIVLHCPDYVIPDPEPEEKALVRRIFEAYKRMKRDESGTRSLYRPSSFWKEQLKEGYSHIVRSYQENNLEPLHFFLSNFGTWKDYTGIEHSLFIRNHTKSALKRFYLQNHVFLTQLKLWKWFYNGQRPLSFLSYPRHGNQAGAFIQNHFIGLSSFFTDIHGSMLAELLNGRSKPVLAELGGGYGKLAHFILRNFSDFAYIDFDLPETLCVASYYLMKAFPEKKALLYGEEPYIASQHDKFDLIFMPSWEIEKVGRETVDLFINKNSLGEMTKEAVMNYVYYMTSAAEYFFHMNHDGNRLKFESSVAGALGREYPVPKNEFTLLFRYPDLAHLLGEGRLNLDSDIFMYLYARKGKSQSTLPGMVTKMGIEKNVW